MDAIVAELLSRGILGIVCIVLGWVIKVLYSDNKKLADERDKLRQEFQAKIDAQSERYVSKSEQWAEKYQEVAVNANAVLDALMRRGQ